MLGDRVLGRLGEYPCIDRYLRHLLEERLALPNAQWSPLVRIFTDQESSPEPLESLLRQVDTIPRFAQIFEVSLGAEPYPDEKINDILAEVRALHHLVYKRSFDNVTVVPRSQGKTVDVTATTCNMAFAIEVKHPRGPEWKDHKEVGRTGAYLLDQGDKVIEVIRRQVGDALRQIAEFRSDHAERDYQGVVLVVNTREDWSYYYREHVEKAAQRVIEDPPQGVVLIAVATIDFVDYDGQTYYHPNESWRHRHTVDIWPL